MDEVKRAAARVIIMREVVHDEYKNIKRTKDEFFRKQMFVMLRYYKEQLAKAELEYSRMKR